MTCNSNHLHILAAIDNEFQLACDMRKLNTHGNIDVDQFSCFGMECADLLKLIMDLVHMNAVMHRKM